MACKPPEVPLDFKNQDPGVQRIVELLELGERTVPYWHLTHRERFGGRFANPGFAYAYVGIAVVLLVGALVTSGIWGEAQWFFVTLVVAGATYRLWDIVRWWVDFLIDRRHYAVVSRERNVVFVALNLFELTLIGAVLFEAAGSRSSSIDSWFDAFFLVTQMGLPSGATSSWERAAQVAVEASALVLLLGGLAALISLVGAKLKEKPWAGPSAS